MSHSRFHHRLWRLLTVGTFCVLFAGLLTSLLAGCQMSRYPGYPEQTRFFPAGIQRHKGLYSDVRPASPQQVTHWLGPAFASLPRLGVVLIGVDNHSRETPIVLSRHSVQLELADDQMLKPLGPAEIVAWLAESYPAEAKQLEDRIQQSEEMRNELEFTRIHKGPIGRGMFVVFRFPQGIPSGWFFLKYTLEAGPGERLVVDTHSVELNIRP